jgi:NAD(P)-dependent dehydrogenase (short-subunit alcohol dehydrogenase family)
MAGRMASKTALIPGTASGLGEAQVKLFAKVGVKAILGAVQSINGQQVAALESVKQGVRISTIFPGQVRTPILGAITPERDAATPAAIPMGISGA